MLLGGCLGISPLAALRTPTSSGVPGSACGQSRESDARSPGPAASALSEGWDLHACSRWRLCELERSVRFIHVMYIGARPVIAMDTLGFDPRAFRMRSG